MKTRQALMKLAGEEANKFGFAPLTKDFLKAKGIPPDAKIARRYHDVSYGKPSVTIVLEHASFAEVESGGQIPEVKPEALAPAKPKQ